MEKARAKGTEEKENMHAEEVDSGEKEQMMKAMMRERKQTMKRKEHEGRDGRTVKMKKRDKEQQREWHKASKEQGTMR